MASPEPNVPSTADLKNIGKTQSLLPQDSLERVKLDLHKSESKHRRTSWNVNYIFLYLFAIATVALILVVACSLLFPMWALFLTAAQSPDFITQLDGSVVVAVLTAPLITIAGLSWATLSAVSGKHLPKVSMRVATGADDSSTD